MAGRSVSAERRLFLFQPHRQLHDVIGAVVEADGLVHADGLAHRLQCRIFIEEEIQHLDRVWDVLALQRAVAHLGGMDRAPLLVAADALDL